MAKPPKPRKPKLTPLVSKDHPRTDFGDWSPDSTPEGADWIKLLGWHLPTDPDNFLKFLRVSDKPQAEQRAAVTQFITLPAARRMPRSLARGLHDRGLLAAPPEGWQPDDGGLPLL